MLARLFSCAMSKCKGSEDFSVRNKESTRLVFVGRPGTMMREGNKEESMSSATVTRKQVQTSSKPRRREWAPRIWEGCNLFAWLGLLWRGRFTIHPKFWHIAIVVTFVELLSFLCTLGATTLLR